MQFFQNYLFINYNTTKFTTEEYITLVVCHKFIKHYCLLVKYIGNVKVL